MSIATKTGDAGTTGMMYNQRVSKRHPRVEAYGSVDELNAALGLARAQSKAPFVAERLLKVQKALVILMGELATPESHLERYRNDGYEVVTSEMVAELDVIVKELEEKSITYRGWATPGATIAAATLDVARTTCRRAERRVAALLEDNGLGNGEILVFLNRLSDVLWLFARWEETQEGK